MSLGRLYAICWWLIHRESTNINLVLMVMAGVVLYSYFPYNVRSAACTYVLNYWIVQMHRGRYIDIDGYFNKNVTSTPKLDWFELCVVCQSLIRYYICLSFNCIYTYVLEYSSPQSNTRLNACITHVFDCVHKAINQLLLRVTLIQFFFVVWEKCHPTPNIMLYVRST